jgi:hypothetical protein
MAHTEAQIRRGDEMKIIQHMVLYLIIIEKMVFLQEVNKNV